MTAGAISTRNRVALAALVVMVGNLAGRLLGLIRELVMAWLFGATGATDAFVAAMAMPRMVYDFLVVGAISAALVPIFVESSRDEARFRRVLSSVLTVAGLLLTMIVALLALLADPLLKVLGAGFAPWQRAAAVEMLLIMLLAVVLQGLAGVFMAVHYSGQRFRRPAFAPAVYNAGIVAGALLLHPVFGVAALALGVLLGAAAQLLLQLGGLRAGWYRPRIDLALPELSAIARLYVPVAVGVLIPLASIAIDRSLASQLEAGSMTVMAYATRLIQFPLGLVGTAISLAVLPTLAKHAGGLTGPSDDPSRQAYRETLSFGIKLVLLLMIPAAVGLILLREPVVRLLFEHRAFTSHDTARTAGALLFYALQLPFTALDQVLIYAFYARRDPKTPVLLGLVSLGAYLLVALSTRDVLGINGLALANTVQNSVHGLILLALLWRALGGLAGLLGYSWRILLAAALMALAVATVMQVMRPRLDGSVMGLTTLVLVSCATGLVVYAAAVFSLRVAEARQLGALVIARLRF